MMNKRKITILPDSIKNWFISILDPLIDLIVRFHVHPNHFTILGLLVSLVGAVFYAKYDIRLAGVGMLKFLYFSVLQSFLFKKIIPLLALWWSWHLVAR